MKVWCGFFNKNKLEYLEVLIFKILVLVCCFLCFVSFDYLRVDKFYRLFLSWMFSGYVWLILYFYVSDWVGFLFDFWRVV